MATDNEPTDDEIVADLVAAAAQRFERRELPNNGRQMARGCPAEETRAAGFVEPLLAHNDEELTARVAKDPDAMLSFCEALDGLIERARAKIEIFQAMRARLLVALSRYELQHSDRHPCGQGRRAASAGHALRYGGPHTTLWLRAEPAEEPKQRPSRGSGSAGASS
jgi:hypothetical protein